jgi:hypothetical protein
MSTPDDLMRTLALELAPHMSRVNSLHPTSVETDMIQNDAAYALFRPDLEHATRDDAIPAFTSLNALPIAWVEPVDISNALLFLAFRRGPVHHRCHPARRRGVTDQVTSALEGDAAAQRGREDPAADDGRSTAGTPNLAETRSRIATRVVGRERELELILAAVAAGRDILLEGPPGTSKSTLLRAITTEWGIPLVFVEGNADLTPAKIVGHHNPARVLREDYSPDNFVDGPLLQAMREGGFLYIEEFNRAPEDTVDTLLTAMAEREIAVPRVGRVVARCTFRVVATMNPYDNVGTTGCPRPCTTGSAGSP